MKDLFCHYECRFTEENTCCLKCEYFEGKCKKGVQCCFFALYEDDKGCNIYKRHMSEKKINTDLFEEKTVISFKSGLDELVGKPIKFIGDKETGNYMYALVVRVAKELMEIRCASGAWMTISAEKLTELDPKILD